MSQGGISRDKMTASRFCLCLCFAVAVLLPMVTPAALDDLREVRLFKGDANTAYRDPAALYAEGRFHLFFTRIESPGGDVYATVCHSESTDLAHWSSPRALTPYDQRLNYSSPGNVVRDGADWVLCLQTYPRPGARLTDVPPRYGDDSCRIWTMRSRDLHDWQLPELLRVKGPDVRREDMGRMIDPYLIRADGLWYCFYKQGGASFSTSPDLRAWTFAGRTDAGENVCVLPDNDGGWFMFHSPSNGIGVKRSEDLVHWRDLPGLITLGQRDWPWARGRLTAGAVLDARNVTGVGKYLLFFHGSGPKSETDGDFDRNASIGLAWSDDLKTWYWPHRN